ncbi:Copia protein, partial [Mucuna pruriens]
MQQPQEKAKEVAGDPDILSPSSQQQESSLESTPRQLRSLVDIYETCNMAMLEPKCYEEVSNKEVWVKAMEEEIKMFEKNNTWELVDCPHGKDIIEVKWVYKTKLNPNGTIQKKVIRLRKTLYGLKQAPLAWYNKIDQYFTDQGFKRSKSKPTLYIKTQDDLIYTRNNMKMMNDIKKDMMKIFEMTDLDLINYFLDIERESQIDYGAAKRILNIYKA